MGKVVIFGTWPKAIVLCVEAFQTPSPSGPHHVQERRRTFKCVMQSLLHKIYLFEKRNHDNLNMGLGTCILWRDVKLLTTLVFNLCVFCVCVCVKIHAQDPEIHTGRVWGRDSSQEI